jgi:hypothetical protein
VVHLDRRTRTKRAPCRPTVRQGRNAEIGFRGEKRSNATHACATDPDALLCRNSRGTRAKLCYMGHVLVENRNELAADAVATRVSGHTERLAAL